MEQPGESRLESFLLDSAERGRRPWSGWRRVLPVTVVLFLLLGWYWSQEPAPLQLAALPGLQERTVVAPGVAMTATLQGIVRTQLDKPGGFLGNDVLPPGVWLDNMAAFERGALTAARDMVRAMRRDFSHAAAVSLEDPDLLRAEPRLFFDGSDWLTAEDEYRSGIAALESYRQRLEAKPVAGAQFHARPDALARWLADIDARMAIYVQQLGMAARDDDARTAWAQVDDVFYEARGYAWALRVQQDAIAVDFAAVLSARDADALLRQVMAELDGTQRPVLSPLIMNGSEYGVLANHSLVMAGYLARTRSAIQQIRARLESSLEGG